MSSERSRATHNSTIGKGFGSSKSSWNSSIWGNANLGSSFTDGPADTGIVRGGDFAGLISVTICEANPVALDQHVQLNGPENAFEGKSGSSSLLSSSESDGWSGRPSLPWSTVSSTSSSLSMAQNKGMAASPVQSRGNDRSAPALAETSDATSYFSLPRPSAIGQTPVSSAQKGYLNPTSEAFSSSSADTISFGSFGGFRNEDGGRRQLNSSAFGGSSVGPGFQTKPALSSADRDVPRSDDIIGSMNIPSFTQAVTESNSQGPSRAAVSAPYSHLSHNSGSLVSQRPSHSAHPFHSESPAFESRYTNGQLDLNSGLSKLQLNNNGFPSQQRPSYVSQGSYDASLNRLKYEVAADEAGYQALNAYTPDGPPELPVGCHSGTSRYGGRGSVSPSDYTRLNSPFYSAAGTPPVAAAQYRTSSANRLSNQVGDGQATLLDRKLRGLQQEQDFAQSAVNVLQPRLQFPTAYDFACYPAARFTSLSGFYPVAPFGGLGAAAFVPRGPHRDHDPSQVVRSPLLEEFRTNSKGNKRYELKVRFSPDWLSIHS